ncbi:hypothetical protein EMELA_v1c00070 [Mesoplasma melaleucae]|uniref:Uncharacterized protein n=1 Tax=Mesoplasma melaleucae TaxID=81459 RepID=A0A2K8NUT3_9MOLU|nr:hypothetical protein EMELA_v1c00070 [Mesoplasma melaleucae]
MEKIEVNTTEKVKFDLKEKRFLLHEILKKLFQ